MLIPVGVGADVEEGTRVVVGEDSVALGAVPDTEKLHH